MRFIVLLFSLSLEMENPALGFCHHGDPCSPTSPPHPGPFPSITMPCALSKCEPEQALPPTDAASCQAFGCSDEESKWHRLSPGSPGWPPVCLGPSVCLPSSGITDIHHHLWQWMTDLSLPFWRERRGEFRVYMRQKGLRVNLLQSNTGKKSKKLNTIKI